RCVRLANGPWSGDVATGGRPRSSRPSATDPAGTTTADHDANGGESLTGKWFGFGGVLLLLLLSAPVVLGLTVPLAVFNGLSPAASGWLCVLPFALLFGRVVWSIRRGRPTRSTQ
ncbi:MAG TPA: hypothetical protein VGD15_13580, partial [Kribbella sp.]